MFEILATMSGGRRLARWLAGLLLGTLSIALSSPLFVRSYPPQDFDLVRGRYVPAPGHRYRWGAEGYATTTVGEHGMPGRGRVPQQEPGVVRLALWGDSQAEGVCVADHEKLFAQIEDVAIASGKRVAVLPFARSGEDASNWLSQIPGVESSLRIDVHLLVIVELSDLLAATRRADTVDPVSVRSRSKIAASLPAFLIQSVRHLITDEQGNRRRLRFHVGPKQGAKPLPVMEAPNIDRGAEWPAAMQAIRNVSKRPIIILYAPRSPHIFDGKIVLHDRQQEQFQAMERAANAARVLVMDVSDSLADSAREGRWPHGFHNGQIGNGHLNGVGNRLIARHVVNNLP